MQSGPPTESVRQFLSRRLIERAVRGLGIGKVFYQSQSWEGYNCACESWHNAYWKWVDQQSPVKLVEHLKKAVKIDWSRLSVAQAVDGLKPVGVDWSKLPSAEEDQKQWLEDSVRQEILQQRAIFSLAMRGPEAQNPETYKMFANDMTLAGQIGDNTFFEEFARQKQRKPTKDKGDRRLKPQLLLYWIPGCLWAFTNDGIAAFLNDLYPRSGNVASRNQVISNAHRTLKLYHSPTPLYWGVTGSPPRLVSL